MPTTVPPDFTADIAQARDKAEAAQREQYELGQETAKLADLSEDAGSQRQETLNDQGTAEGDRRRLEQEKKGDADALRQVGEAAETEQREIDKSKGELNVSQTQNDASRKLAQDVKDIFRRTLFWQHENSLAEAWAEIENNQLEVWRVLAMTCLQSYAIVAAWNGTRTPFTINFEPKKYLQIRAGEADPSEQQLASVASQEEGLRAQQANLAEREVDASEYHDRRIEDYAQRAKESAGEYAGAMSAEAAANRALDAAKRAYEEGRKNLRDAQRGEGEHKIDELGPAQRKVEEVGEEQSKAYRAEDREAREKAERERAATRARRPATPPSLTPAQRAQMNTQLDQIDAVGGPAMLPPDQQAEYHRMAELLGRAH